MTRVIAGAARGRRLAVPSGGGTRPTADRAREALFSTLESLLGPWAGRRVLDLYAGSGAVGLEALSRGAAHVLLVESDARAARTVTANIGVVGLPGAEVRAARVERVVRELAGGLPYDLVFADPPYDVPHADLQHALSDVLPVLTVGAVLAVERATRSGTWDWPAGVEAVRSRRYGEATLWYGRATTTPHPPPPTGPGTEEPTA